MRRWSGWKQILSEQCNVWGKDAQANLACPCFSPHVVFPSVACAGALLLSSFFTGLATASERTYVSVYAATYSPSSFLELIAPVNVEMSSRSRLAALAIGRPLADFWGLEWDVEGQVVRHWGDQTNFEFNALYLARWRLPILEELVAPAFAFGHGISWATEPPALEPSGDPNEESSEILNYLMGELEFAPPSAGQWSGFLRVHHRSGVFGLISGIKGGSNFVGAGIRYRF